MAKGFASPVLNQFFSQNILFPLAVLALTAFTLSSCAKKQEVAQPNGQIVTSEPFAITADKLQNCRFKNPAPTYSFNASIDPNPVLCDDGVPRKVELLTPNPLPNGIEFTMNQLSLTGSAKERVVSAPYEFYLENEAGYQIIKLTLTVK